MRKLFTLILVVLLTISLFGCNNDNNTSDVEAIKASGVLRVGMECDYTPFNWMVTKETATSEKIQSGGYADGYDVYFSTIIAQALGVKVEVVKVEWNGLTLALEAGTIDCIIAGMSPTAQRKLTVDFTDAYYGGQKAIIVRKDSSFASAQSIADFKGSTLAHQQNNVFNVLLEQIENCNINNKYDSTPRMIEATIAKEIDGFVDEIDVAKAVCSASDTLTYIVFEQGQGFDISETVNAIACRKGSDLVPFINDVLSGIDQAKRDEMMETANNAAPLN